MWVFLRKNLWLCWAFANKTPLEEKNGTDRQPWITASNNTAAFSTENTTLNAFDTILKGPFLYRRAEAYRQRTFQIDKQPSSVRDRKHMIQSTCMRWVRRLQKRCGIHPLWWTLHGEIHSSCLRLHRFENDLCLVIFLNWPLSLLQQNKPWRHVVSPKVNTSKVKTGSNK